MSVQPPQDRTLWDYIRNGISAVTNNQVTQGIGSVVSTAFQNPVGQASIKVAKAAGAKLADAFGTLGQLEGETLKGNAARQKLSEIILPNTIGGYTATKEERKKASEKISIGRAALVRTDTILEKVLGRNILSSLQPESYDPRTGQIYNVYKDAQRDKYMSGLGFAGNLVSGTTDLVYGSIVSPFIVFGAFGKLGRTKALEPTITTERVVAKSDLQKLERAEQDITNYVNAENRLYEIEAEDITVTGRTAKEVMDEKAAIEKELDKLLKKANKAATDLGTVGYANGFDEFVRQATVLNAEQLIKHRVVRESSDPDLLAGLLGETKNPYEVALIVRAAAGDVSAQRLLASTATSTFMALQRAKQPMGTLTEKLKALKQTDGDLSEFALLPQNADLLADEFADLVRKDVFLQRAVRAADEKVLEGRTGTSVFSTVESFRAAKAKTFGEIGSSTNRLWDVEYFRRNPFVATVAVATWPFRERPSGWVRTKGVNSSDGAREIEAFMGKVKAWEGVEGQAKRQQYMRQYLSAVDEVSREQIVMRIEQDAVKSIGKKYGLEAKEVDEILAKLDKERGNTIKFFRERGFLIDENNERIYAPQLKTQLADSVPMIDIDKFDKLMKANASAWGAARDFATEVVVKPLDTIDEIWRPLVLMRLGYTQRNVGEGWGRLAAFHGGLTSLRTAWDALIPTKAGAKYNGDVALANWARNRHAGLINEIAMRRAVIEAKNTELIAKGVATGSKGLPPLRTSWDRVISFQQDAITINKLKITQLQDELKALKKEPGTEIQRQNIINELAERRKFEVEANARLREYAKEANKKGVKGNRYRIGQGFLSYGDYDNLPMSFQGDFGDVLMELSGTQSRIAMELSSSNRVYAGFDSSKFRNVGFTELKPTDPNYFIGLARVVNRQFRNSPVMVRILRGDSIESVVAFLKTPAGRKEMRAGRYVDEEEFAMKMFYAAERYIPDATLRQKLAKEELTPAELSVALKGRDDLRTIHGEKIEEIPDLELFDWYRQKVRGIFRYIGAMPEDVFVRHPFANAVYQKALRESIDNANRQGVKLTANELEGIVTGARRKALQETRRYLFTIERYSNAANTVRFLEPFFMAAQNTAQVWAKLAYRDPRLLGFAGYIYTAPDRAGLIQTDPLTEREVVVMQVPDWMRKGPMKKLLANVESVSFEKGGANLILQGQDWWRIGDGVFTQIAASEFAKLYPDTKFRPILDYVLGGYSPSRMKGSIDYLAPTVLKRIIDVAMETDSRDYASSLIIISQIENNKYRRGERDEPTAEEVKQRADAYSFLRAISSFTLPVALRYRPEFQFYVDKARLYREKYGPDAPVRFYQDYPDYFEMFFSVSRNPTGMDPTTDAASYKKKYSNLIDAITDPRKGFQPEFLQLITNSYGAPTEFDATAYTWQFLNEYRTGSGEMIRQRQGVDDIATVNSLQRGWIEWTKFKTKLDETLQARGLTSYNQTDASDLQELKQLYVEQQKTKNPVWWKEYNEAAGSERPYFFVQAVKLVLNDKKFMADRGQAPVWDAFNEYIKAREVISKALKARKAAGGSSNIDANSNKELRDLWAIKVEQMKTIDPTGAFTTFYNRFLDNDTFEEIK